MMQDHSNPPISPLSRPLRVFAAIVCVLLVNVALAAEPGPTSASLRIVFNENSVAHSAKYTLGEIAKVQARDPQEARRLECLVMGDSPSVGYRPLINAHQVAAQLERQGFKAPEVALEFPERMFVEREVQSLDMKALEEAIRKEALTQLTQSDGVLIDKIQLPKSVMLPAGDLAQQIEIRLPRRSVGSASYTVDLLVDGEGQRRLAGSFQIDMEVDALRLQRPVRRGDALDLTACQTVRQRVSQVQGNPLTAADLEQSTLRARRDMTTGEIVSWSNVDRVMLVRSGQTVRMELQSAGGMHITTVGQARGNGSLGDQIDVVNPTSGKIVQAVVTGNQLVRVTF